MFQESPETNSTGFSHAIENSSKFNQVYSISNPTSDFIFRAEKLNWTYCTSTQLLYAFPRADISNKTEAEEEQTFPSVICPGQQGLQWLGISQLKREDKVLCSTTSITAGTQLKLEEQEAGNRNTLRDTRFVTQGCSSTDKSWKNRSKGRWTHLDGKETW